MAPSIFDLTVGKVPEPDLRLVLSQSGAKKLREEFLDPTSERWGYDIRPGDVVEVLGVNRVSSGKRNQTEIRITLSLPVRARGGASISPEDDLFSGITTESVTYPGRERI